jgi:hypothetical protein
MPTTRATRSRSAAQIGLTGVAARAGQDLHDHRLGDGDRVLGRDQLFEPAVDRAPGGPVVLDPG